ncbi:MAG TPA: hypothetical protein VMM93_09060 [Vicinamibacterales bacterium]|nr:hypothetical protein [Vicinamibacterales bacterium]
MRGTLAAIVVTGLGCLLQPAPASAQVTVDRVLERVADQVITELDVRRVRLLALVPDATSDAAAQRGLENHLLMAAEVARFKPELPDDATVAALRRAWQERVAPGGDVASLLERAGSTEGELAAWFRQELLIGRHLDRLFGRLQVAERDAAVADWIGNLRSRAGLR